jgi:Flp pilus assembly protein TadB
MSLAVALLVALWLALIVTRAVERRPARRVAQLWRQALPSGLTGDEMPRRRRPSALSGRWRLMLSAAAVAIVALLVIGPVGAAVAAASVPVVAGLRTRRTARARVATMRARLPDAVDLLVVAGTAGLAPRQALALVSERGPPELRPAFAEVVARAGAGEPWARAVPRLLTSVGEPARGVVHAIVAAEQDGAPMGTVLSRLADDARRQRRHDLEAAVRRLPVRLSFPLVCWSPRDCAASAPSPSD